MPFLAEPHDSSRTLMNMVTPLSCKRFRLDPVGRDSTRLVHHVSAETRPGALALPGYTTGKSSSFAKESTIFKLVINSRVCVTCLCYSAATAEASSNLKPSP